VNAAEIAHALGGRRTGRAFMARCPVHNDRTPSLSIADGERGLLVKCFAGCEARDVLAELRARGLLSARQNDRPPRCDYRPRDTVLSHDRDPEFMRRLWRESHDPRATLAETYLQSRGLDLEPDLCGRVLRFHPQCPFGPGTKAPALIARFSPIANDPGEDAPPVALLRVGLEEHGHKIGKKMLGPVAGAAIKLDADEDVTYGLGICEGLEDALDVRQRGWRPIWALGSADAIKTFPLLAGVDALTIFADNDPNKVGLDRARACADTWRSACRAVAILPPRGAKDWNEADR
jgi:putative DNA primase/helicase